MEDKRNILLYYICAVLELIICVYTFSANSPLLIVSFIINVITIVVFIILSFKMKLSNYNRIVPFTYIAFYIIMIIITVIFNSKALAPGISTPYYLTFVSFAFTILSIYSLLSFTNKKPIKK